MKNKCCPIKEYYVSFEDQLRDDKLRQEYLATKKKCEKSIIKKYPFFVKDPFQKKSVDP